MATILKGYRGNSNPEDPIKNITSTYDSDIMGGKKKKGEEVVDPVTKHEALVIKAEEKGWSDRKKVRKGVEEDPAIIANLESVITGENKTWKSKYNIKGEGKGLKEVKEPGGELKGGLGGFHIKTPRFSVTKEKVIESKVPLGKPNPFYLDQSIGQRIKSRIKGFGPNASHWKEGFQIDWSKESEVPYQPGISKPTGKEKFKRSITFEGWK